MRARSVLSILDVAGLTPTARGLKLCGMAAGVAIDPVAIVHAIPYPAFLVVNGTLAAANGPARELLDIPPDAVSTPLRDLRVTRRVPELSDVLAAALEGQTGPALSVGALVTPAGVRHARFSARPVVVDSESRAVLVVAEDLGPFAVDADARDDAASRFVATVAHELRNPLSAIMHALHLIGHRMRDDRIVRQVRMMAERQARHQARLLDDLFDLTRLRTGKIELHPERLNLAEIVTDVAETIRLDVDVRAQRLVVVVTLEHIPIRGDRTRLEQVLRNLLDNARKYTPVGGQIDVWVGVKERDAVVRVTDSGLGIEADALERIFEPYAQGDAPGPAARDGLGLGLSLVRSFVEQHGGSVTARSGGRGAGSEFEVRLPLDAAPAPARVAPPQRARVTPSRRRILVIEDDRDARELLRLVLELDGHTVETAGTGADGVRMAGASAPDVVLIDVGLPEIDGYEVARRIRARLGGAVRLVAVTGYSGTEATARVRDAGFDAHVVKPAGPEEINAALAG